jgi:hypothetical protein
VLGHEVINVAADQVAVEPGLIDLTRRAFGKVESVPDAAPGRRSEENREV